MGSVKLIFLVVFTTLVAFAALLFMLGYTQQQEAALKIDTVPEATVFVDNQQVGRTPLEIALEPGSVLLKLVPDNANLLIHETQVDLEGGVQTVVNWQFGQLQEEASGEIAFFTKGSKQTTGISIVSNPDAAQISLNGKVRGFTPFKLTKIPLGQHVLNIQAEGYQARMIPISIIDGYRLILAVKLAKLPPVPEIEELIEEKVEILSTPTGFLRVREEPSFSAEELIQVKPGEIFDFLQVSEDSQWWEIGGLPDSDSEGWILAKYATKSAEITN